MRKGLCTQRFQGQSQDFNANRGLVAQRPPRHGQLGIAFLTWGQLAVRQGAQAHGAPPPGPGAPVAVCPPFRLRPLLAGPLHAFPEVLLADK